MGLLSRGSKPVLGLNIGSKHIKAVEVRNNRGRLELLGAGVRPTPDGVISNGIIVDPGLLGSEIRELLNECGIRSKRVVSSVAGQQSLVVRIIEVPRMTKAELQETMKWEIERHIPFPAEDVVMDFRTLEKAEAGETESETMEVLLAVAQEELINAHVSALDAAGLVPTAIDIEPLAVARTLAVLEDNGGDEKQTLALINLGAKVTDISVVEGADLTFTRTVPLGGENLTLAIAEALGLQPQEAERAKTELGTALLAAAGQSGVDSMGFQPAGGEDQDSPFAAFEFDAAADDVATDQAVHEAAPEIITQSETTGEVPEFDLSLDSFDVVGGGESETTTAGEVPAFDLGFGATDEATGEAATDDQPAMDLSGDLGFSLDSADVEFLDTDAGAAEDEASGESADDDGTIHFGLSLDGLSPAAGEPAAEEPDTGTTEATLALDTDAEQVPDQQAPPSLQLDLGPADTDTEQSTDGQDESPASPGGFELDFGPALPSTGADDASPGAFELDMGPAAAGPQEEGSTGGFELDFGVGAGDTETDPGGVSSAAGIFDLSPVAKATEPDGAVSPFSFDLEEPSTGEDDSPAAVSAMVAPEQAVSTEEDTTGGLMDLDAIAGLSELGTAGGEVTEETVHAAISPVINELLTETRRSLEYYTSRYQGANIDKVLLLGGTAKLRGLADVLAGELGLRVEIANPFQFIQIGPKCDLAPEYVQELSPALCVGLGLAIRDMVEG